MALSAAARAQVKAAKEDKPSDGGAKKPRADVPKGQSREMRVIPRRDPDKIPFVTGWQHWLSRAIVPAGVSLKVPKYPLNCPGGKECSLCEALWKQNQDKHPEAKSNFVVFGKKKAGATVVLVRGEEQKGPQILNAGSNHDGTGIFDKMLRQYPDEDSPHADVDPYDAVTGFDFTLTNPQKDARYDFELSRWASRLAKTDEDIQKYMDAAEELKLDDEFAVTDKTREELKAMAEAVLAGNIRAPERQAPAQAGGGAAGPQTDSLAGAEAAAAPATTSAAPQPPATPQTGSAPPPSSPPAPSDLASRTERIRQGARAVSGAK